MRLVSEGLSNKEIGRRLNIADRTIKVHLHHIFQKLDSRSSQDKREALARGARAVDEGRSGNTTCRWNWDGSSLWCDIARWSGIYGMV